MLLITRATTEIISGGITNDNVTIVSCVTFMRRAEEPVYVLHLFWMDFVLTLNRSF